MPVFRNRAVLEIARGVKAFFSIEAGITRGEVPKPTPKTPEAPGPPPRTGRPRGRNRPAPEPSSHAGVSNSVEDHGNFLLVTYDSCRFDAYKEADTPILDAHAEARLAYSQATYTYASHASMFQGILPHVFAEEDYYNRYVRQLWRIRHRRPVEARAVLPPESRSVIDGFNRLGYFTCGTGAMAWFRGGNHLEDDWGAWQWTGTDARRQIDWTKEQLKSHPEKPFFAFINFGETHFPYSLDGRGGVEDAAEARSLRQIGIVKDRAFDKPMWKLQVAAAEFLDERMGDLLGFLSESGRRVTVVMCADHGDCFGEDGLYGHGFHHPKVIEVPMAVFEVDPGKQSS